MKTGELAVVVVKENPPDPRYKQEEGTVSQTIAYRDKDGNTVAEAHQFKKKDGSLGASGRPDPKRVVHEGKLYYLDR